MSDRYTERPILRLFEALILDIIGELPPGNEATLERMNLQKVFSTRAQQWRKVVSEVLNLSDTFQTAVLDLWYKNSDVAEARGTMYEPSQFAQDFADRYLADDSTVDVWTPEALKEAEERIQKRRLTTG